ncbi:hypothetical protein B0T20DRAFT_101681 [Sordaria brevicollis]|uniref:Kelch repeat-containing protein n=1 Tax=Sordaria brevicollis TaxID=83679 RepID=A0AAE0NWH4_SORBR|nr:hypothetical protein B0T20DRAFT_101681 [Sordaria brevicollis]
MELLQPPPPRGKYSTSTTTTTLLFTFLLSLLISSAHAELLDSPSPENFLRRIQARAAVIGSHVYIDGGELSQLDTSTGSISSRPSNGVNSTLSIPLSTSWNASSVQIKIAARKDVSGKGPYAMNSQSLWPTPDGNGFYVYGGGASYGVNSNKIDKSGVWKFTADGNGGGSWGFEAPAPTSPVPPRGLRLVEQAAFVSTGKGGMGFSVGGVASAWTDPSNPHAEHIPGMVVYDMNRREWRNETNLGFVNGGSGGSLKGGVGVFVPSFSAAGSKEEEEKENGLVFILGGSVFAVPATTTGNQPDFVMGFENVTFFDPVTREWFWQETTGEVPSPREKFCAVGVEGKDGSFEMYVSCLSVRCQQNLGRRLANIGRGNRFMYGGADSKTEESYNDVYVLSLPGFVWFRAADQSQERRAHPACAVVGKGKRQMLSIGGKEIKAKWSSKDSFPQGLGIFDMTAMTWSKDGIYDAEMGDYERPGVVRDWYSKDDNLAAVSWSSDKVKNMFLNPSPSTDDSGSPTAPSTSSSASSDSQTGDGKKSSNNVGAIAGGVVAGVAGLAILGGLLFYFLKKSRKTKPSELDGESSVGEGTPAIAAFAAENNRKELVTVEKPVEVYVAPEELPTENNHHWELDGTGTQVDRIDRGRYT